MKKKITILKEVRKRQGLTQTDIAKKLGVARMSVTYYENGDMSPLMKNFRKFIEAYGLTMEELMEYLKQIED